MSEIIDSQISNANKNSSKNSIAILGGSLDKSIPVLDLANTFELNCKFYNRSFENLSIKNAKSAYLEYIAPLNPNSILIHLGEADVEMFDKDKELFDGNYISLITAISEENPASKIAVVSLSNETADPIITNMNRHIKAIALSERCEYFNIESAKLWNPKNTKEFFSFVYSSGFLHKQEETKPLSEIVKVLYGYAFKNLKIMPGARSGLLQAAV